MSTRSLRSRQPFTGRRQADTRLARNYLLAGDVSNSLKETFMQQTGRSLAGFGDMSGPSGPGGDPDTADESVRGMEDADDTAGSGVLDQPGSGPTANANMGVFASYYSVPGYLAREVPNTVSVDEFDATSSAPIVTLPSGALPFVTRRADLLRGSPREQTYIDLTSQEGPGVVPAPDSLPGGDYSAVPPQVLERRVPRALTGAPLNASTPIAGFGETTSLDTSFWLYAVGGAALGIAAVWAWDKYRK